MSLFHSEQFNVWFPAIVVGFFISLVVAALWDFIRRRFWLVVSGGNPVILREVGLDSRYQSRAEAVDQHRETIDKLNEIARGMNLPISPKSPNSDAIVVVDMDVETGINSHQATLAMRMTGTTQGMYSINSSSENHTFPGETFQNVDCRPIINFTSYFPDGTSKDVTRPAKKLYKRHADGRVKRIKSSIILQASIAIDPLVLTEIIELAKHCLQKENRCIFQLGNWAILYYNAGEVQMHLLKEGDVPMNVEARWQDGKTGITMRGLYLTGSQVKVGTKRTSKILRSAGPATQGAGDLDELHLPTGEFDVPGEDSLIYASKVIGVDGISLTVRSEASFILAPHEKNALIEAVWTRWLWISNSAKKMLRSFMFRAEDCQPERAANRPELEFDPEQLELSVQHWKGLSQIELLNTRKEVLRHLQEQRASRIIERAGPPSPHSYLFFVRDEHYLEYWQEGLRVLNEVIHRNSNDSHFHAHIRVRGGIQFLLGDYESALQDYDLALLNMGGHQSTVLLERALVKCMLGRCSEAMQDVVAVITLNPNVNDIQELQTCIQQILDQQKSFRIVTESGSSCQRPLPPDQEKAVVKIPDLLTGDKWHSGEIGSQIPPISDAGTARDHGACKMVTERIPQVRQALETIKHVCTMSSAVCVNKYQCKRIADRFSAIGEGLKDFGWDRNFNVGNASDGCNHVDYPAFDELLTVLRKGEALVSSYIGCKGIISVVGRTDNRESFKEIHEELDTLKVQFDIESFSELGQVKDFESSSGVERKNALAEDADQDLTDMPKDMALIKESKNVTGMDMDKATLVVLEKSGLWNPRDELPSYLRIDPTAIKIKELVRSVVPNSERVKADELDWAAERYCKWIGCDFAAKVFKSAAIDLTGWNSKQLLTEVGSLANLRHPHIVGLVGFGQDAEQCVFVTELMDADLRSFMRKKLETFPIPKPRPFNRPQELDIITQIAKGMHYMHTQQYAHADLKCSNILVKNFGSYFEVKIADFGSFQKLGKVWDEEAFKQTSKTRRTRWSAPEVLGLYGGKDTARELLKKSDVYNFGMTCYEVVTGKYPFMGLKEDELLKQIHAGVRPELPGDLDVDLKGLIKQCWDREPNKRPEFGEIIPLLNYIRSKKPVVVWNRLSSQDMVLSLMKKIPQIHGLFTGLPGLVRQGKEHPIDYSHYSSVWGVKGDGGFQLSDRALSVPEYLRIQPGKLDKVRRIGEGASAVVYEATWLGCTFAVKVLKKPPSNVQALQQKVDFLINVIRHPCIAQMVGLSVDSHQRCSIVMELMDCNLHDLIQSRMRKRSPVTTEEKGLLEAVVVPFELHEALPVISKIAWGMAFLHSKGVMHRDLKPENVLVTNHGVSMEVKVKLGDFGMSLRELESHRHGSYSGIGTTFWRAPELTAGRDSWKKPEYFKADVYSFAVTCSVILSGKEPFSNPPLSEYDPVIGGERPTLPDLLHPGLKDLVRKCLHSDPKQRPNFTEICKELQKIRQSLSCWHSDPMQRPNFTEICEELQKIRQSPSS